jgi:P-type E1-E2 ATPase
VGSIVKVRCDEFIPADLLILSCSNDKGVCYVETKNLDGETNLKVKYANKDIQPLYKNMKSLSSLSGIVECEGPNNAIYKFEGMVKIP